MPEPLGFGVFLAPFHALHEDPTQALHRDLELIEWFDRLGLDEVWVGEHHSGGFEIIPAPEVFIAAAAERTKHIRLGTGVKSLPYYHPMIVADEMVLLDHLTRGRVMFGVGPGALPTDAHHMGIDVKDQRRRMAESLEVIVPLLEGETVTRETDWFTIRDARLQMQPYTRPRMEMAVTSIRSPAGAIEAGKYGAGLLVLGGTSDDAMAYHAKNWEICQETAADHGRTVARDQWRITAWVHLAETREKAISDIDHGFLDWFEYSKAILPGTPIPFDTPDPKQYALDNQVAIIGTPDDAIREIERMQAASGGFGKLLALAHNWAPFADVKRSYELLARYVVPHFTGNLDARRASHDFGTEHIEEMRKDVGAAVESSQKAYEAHRKSKGAKAAE